MLLTVNQNNVRYSIVNDDQSEIKRDQTTPFSYIDFIKYGQFDISSKVNLINAYRGYLVRWLQKSKNTGVSEREIQINAYKQLLLEIQLTFVNQDEQRYLEQFDINDPLELEIVIPFYVEKIKEITLYFLEKRYDLQRVKLDWSSRGSRKFIEDSVKKFIFQNFTKNEKTFERYKADFIELSALQGNFILNYEDLYDLSDYRQNVYDADLTTLSADDLLRGVYGKYIIQDIDIVNDGELIDSIESKTSEFNQFNLNTPFVSLSSNNSNLISVDDLGGYFKPQYIHSSTYFSPTGITIGEHDGIAALNDSSLYGNGLEYNDFYFWSKHQPSFQGLEGKPVRDTGLKRFYGYVSRSETLGDSTAGVLRYTDNISNWTGEKNDKWANKDVFEEYDNNILNRKEKDNTFFNLADNEGVVKYAVDIYGNEFYLVKTVKITDTPQLKVYPLSRSADMNLLGHSVDSIELSAIGMNSSVVGYYTEITEFLSDDLSSYNIDVPYFNREDTSFNSAIDENYPDLILEDGVSISDYSSIYEQSFKVGRVYIRTADGGKYLNLEDIFNEDIAGLDFSKIIDIEIIFDTLIVKTESKIVYTKIHFDYTNSAISTSTIIGRSFENHNNPLYKTGDIWYDGGSYVYTCEVEVNEHGIVPLVRRLDINNLHLTKVYDDIDPEFLEFPEFIEIDSISRPSITKHSKYDRFSVTVLVKDIFKNYYFVVYVFNLNINNNFELVDVKITLPEETVISPNITSYAPDFNPVLEPLYDTIVDSINDGYRVYFDNVSSIETDISPYVTTYEISSYNIDKGLTVESLPNLSYSLGDFPHIEPEIDEDDENNIVTYRYNLGDLYGPCDIELDILKLNGLVDVITTDNNIFSIVYRIDGKKQVKGILSASDVGRDYNNTFIRSPINGKNLVERFQVSGKSTIKSIVIDMYSLNNTLYRVEIILTLHTIDINNRFTDLNLLDTRYYSSEGEDYLKIYLNTRNPDYITGLTLII